MYYVYIHRTIGIISWSTTNNDTFISCKRCSIYNIWIYTNTSYAIQYSVLILINVKTQTYICVVREQIAWYDTVECYNCLEHLKPDPALLPVLFNGVGIFLKRNIIMIMGYILIIICYLLLLVVVGGGISNVNTCTGDCSLPWIGGLWLIEESLLENNYWKHSIYLVACRVLEFGIGVWGVVGDSGCWTVVAGVFCLLEDIVISLESSTSCGVIDILWLSTRCWFWNYNEIIITQHSYITIPSLSATPY